MGTGLGSAATCRQSTMPGEGESFEDIPDNEHLIPQKFTWRDLSKLNRRHNAHVAYRRRVSEALFIIIPLTMYSFTCIFFIIVLSYVFYAMYTSTIAPHTYILNFSSSMLN